MAGWRYSRENREWGGEREGKPESYSRDTRGGGGGDAPTRGMHRRGVGACSRVGGLRGTLGMSLEYSGCTPYTLQAHSLHTLEILGLYYLL